MTFPTMTSTYKQTRTGISDIVAVTPGETYTLSLAKNGGTAQILWNDKPGTSALDSEWTSMSELDATDETGLVPPAGAKAICVSVTAVPAGSPRLPVSLTVVASTATAVHQKGHAKTGRSGGVSGSFVADEYNALVLADGADVFWPLDDGVLDPLTNVGPETESNWTDEQIEVPAPAIVENEPWVGAKSSESDDTRFRIQTATYTIDKIDEWGSVEIWIRPNTVASGRNVYMIGSDRGMIQFGGSGQLRQHVASGATALADPGAWVASTAYVIGDRVRLVADTGARMHECIVAGTSSACEPVFSVIFGTVVDNDITWQDCGARSEFNEVGSTRRGGDADPSALWGLDLLTGNDTAWYHVVSIRRANGNLAMYVNGEKAYELDVQASSGNIGTQGLPKPLQVDSAGFTAGTTRWLGDNGSEEDEFRGKWSKFAIYQLQELTDAQILAHYDKGVELGLV